MKVWKERKGGREGEREEVGKLEEEREGGEWVGRGYEMRNEKEEFLRGGRRGEGKKEGEGSR